MIGTYDFACVVEIKFPILSKIVPNVVCVADMRCQGMKRWRNDAIKMIFTNQNNEFTTAMG